MKKLLTFMAMTVLTLSLTACFSEEKAAPTGETMEITHGFGVTDVPVNPKKVAIFDLAAIDILNQLGVGDRIAGIPKKSQVSYLKKYFDDANVIHLGDFSEIDMEALNSLQPDLIIIGGRQHSYYDEFTKIAPTISSSVNSDTHLYLTAVIRNITNIAKIFNKEEKAATIIKGLEDRIAVLKKAAEGKNAIVAMVSGSAVHTLGKKSRCSLISNEIGYENLTETNSNHGDSVTFEFLLDKNPDYLFILDRDYAIGAEGAKLAKEVIENELVMQSNAYKNGNIIYLTPEVWYLAEGGIEATSIMLSDIESKILK